jgi:hypothetical protein
LAKLAERSFLNLWSYPNPFINKKQNGAGFGKELCDLLVVCGDDVIIFSDKTIDFPKSEDVAIAWSRWYRRAIQHSVKQVCGAERWISQFPDRIYLDPGCSQLFPIRFPPPNTRRVHAVIIALGAKEACKQFFGGGSGSLMIKPSILGENHCNPESPEFFPFTVGDVNPGGTYIHVFDDFTLNVVMGELDTITDFVRYLQKRSSFARSGNLVGAAGEEDLLAYYLTMVNKNNEHDFVHPEGLDWGPDDHVFIDGDHYSHLIKNPKYHAKKESDRISYLWDRLIQVFTTHMINGTSIVPEGHTFDLSDQEQGIRYMALQDRLHRRMHSIAIQEAMLKGVHEERFVRALLPGPQEKDRTTGFFLLLLAYPDHLDLSGGYEQYRRVRLAMLKAYALNLLRKNLFLKRVIGIATEPPSAYTGRIGSSEDMIFAEPDQWTAELIEEASELAQVFDVLKDGRVGQSEIGADEYPQGA